MIDSEECVRFERAHISSNLSALKSRPMKQLVAFIMSAVAICAHAQSPQAISYQAVATNLEGAPLENQAIVVKFSILQGAPTGSVVYIETHNTATDQYGMFNLNLGLGIHQGSTSSLGEVNWGVASHFLKVDLDIDGSGSFVSMGTQQMMSVPYALYAAEADVAANDEDQDASNELQTLTLSGDTLRLSNGGEVILPQTFASSGPSEQYRIECVDMGFSAICGAIGLEPQVSLGPNSNGYQYTLSGSYDPGADFLFNAPHWRKFQIFGLPEDFEGKIYATYQTDTSSDGWKEAFTSVQAEVDGDGGVFVYFWNIGSSSSAYDCIQDGVELEIPMESAFQTNCYYNCERWTLWYGDGASLVSTGLMIDF